MSQTDYRYWTLLASHTCTVDLYGGKETNAENPINKKMSDKMQKFAHILYRKEFLIKILTLAEKKLFSKRSCKPKPIFRLKKVQVERM